MRPRTLEALVMTLALLAPAAAQAGWRDVASAYDQGRLARLDQARSEGMADSGGMPGVQDAMRAPIVAPGGLAGSYRCRTIKLGGVMPSIAYTWHNCRISDQGGRLVFEKLDGTQRMAGALYPEGNGFVYLGASWVKGEKPHRYSGPGASVGARATPDDQVGMLYATARGARIEMPYPVQESTFDVIELRR
jgi:hypothetical protein